MRVCAEIENLIWESLGTGKALDAKAAEHVKTCPDCAAVLQETKQSLVVLECLKETPQAPDCRNAVAFEISRLKKRRSPWKSIWVGVPAAAAASLYLLFIHFDKPPVQVVTTENKPGHSVGVPPPVENHKTLKSHRGNSENPSLSHTISTPNPIHVAEDWKPIKGIRPDKSENRNWNFAAAKTGTVKTGDGDENKTYAYHSDTERVAISEHSPKLVGTHSALGHPSPKSVNAIVATWTAEPRTDFSIKVHDVDPKSGTLTKGYIKRNGDNVELELVSDASDAAKTM